MRLVATIVAFIMYGLAIHPAIGSLTATSCETECSSGSCGQPSSPSMSLTNKKEETPCNGGLCNPLSGRCLQCVYTVVEPFRMPLQIIFPALPDLFPDRERSWKGSYLFQILKPPISFVC